ncbi:MAG TPA: acetate--CoA ligase family protein, partial [Polyangiaceae bacterium]
MPTSRSNLQRLLCPRSVAVVGASASADKAGYQALLALESFGGEVFAINPRASEILGRRAYPSLRALARPVDLALFAVPAPACPAAVRDAIESDCGGGVIVSGGFAESGLDGSALQSELEHLCNESGFRLLGPNTAGFVNHDVSLTASFVSSAAAIPAGNVAVVAQSAGINLTVSFLLSRLGFGVSCAVGLGNAVNVDAADVLEFLADQSSTKAIALHLEGVRRGRRLYETLRRVVLKKPIAVLTVGREDTGEFARSHTGNLVGSHALRSSALQQAGAVLVDSTEELATAAAALSLHRLSPNPRPGIGILTAQAGAGLVMLDRLKSRSLSVPELTASTIARIGEQLPPMTYVKNPVDTGRPGPSFPDVLLTLASDERVDVVITYALNEPAVLQPAEVLPRVARAAAKPILFGTTGPLEDVAPTRAALQTSGLYVAGSPEELVDAAVAIARDAALRARPSDSPAIAGLSDGLALPRSPDEHSAKQILETLGVPAPKRLVCATREDAHAALRALKPPVVAKILSSEVAHKTELGGVELGIFNAAQLDAALSRFDGIALTGARRYLIEETAPPGLELIVGALRDPSFGTTLMVGLGGTLAEATRDTAM